MRKGRKQKVTVWQIRNMGGSFGDGSLIEEVLVESTARDMARHMSLVEKRFVEVVKAEKFI